MWFMEGYPFMVLLPYMVTIGTFVVALMGCSRWLQDMSSSLTSKERSPFFGPFLKFGQAIVDVIFVQKISNFW
jgi:hypothetical protein